MVSNASAKLELWPTLIVRVKVSSNDTEVLSSVIVESKFGSTISISRVDGPALSPPPDAFTLLVSVVPCALPTSFSTTPVNVTVM